MRTTLALGTASALLLAPLTALAPVAPAVAAAPTSLAYAAPTGPSAASSPTASDEVAPRRRSLRAIGHRGHPGRAVTENTTRSFTRAVRSGGRGVELDVRITADGRFVVMHDDSLARTTTCRGGSVSRSSLGWIRRTCRGLVRGERIPSLADAAVWFRQHRGITPVVEIKDGPWTAQRFRALRQTLAARSVLRRTRVVSGSLDLLRRAEQAAPSLRTHAQVDSESEARELMRSFPALSGLHLYAADANPGLVRDLKAQSLTVYGRLTSSPGDWGRLRWAGVDGIITDAVRRLSGRSRTR